MTWTTVVLWAYAVGIWVVVAVLVGVLLRIRRECKELDRQNAELERSLTQ